MRRKLRKLLVKLFKLNNTPHEIALGIAIGVFIAIMPLYGLHTIIVIVAALLVRRSNKIAMFLGTNISLPPSVPFITWTGYEIGRFIFWGKYPVLNWAVFKDFAFSDWDVFKDFAFLNWAVLKDFVSKKIAMLAQYYPPLFIGSFFLGLVLAVMFYFITYFILQRITKQKQTRRAHHRHAYKK
ncbi:MAG: DUF2062 domain-containing protein [Candidatus Omnitrophota bacterium]